MGDTITDTPFKVGITFSDATIKLGSNKLEELIAAKAPLSHKHPTSQIEEFDSSIESKLTDYVKKADSFGNVNLGTGTLQCKDIYFKIDEVNTQLSTAIKALQNPSMTIQHLTLTYDSNVKVGSPVFFTGEVASKDFTPIIISSTDCVPLVKSTGDWTTFAGICTEVDVSYKNKTTKYYRDKNCAFIRFATHGDFQMAVEDATKYKVGDLITYDEEIVNTDETPSYKTQMSIVGSITAIINKKTVAVFRI